MPLPYPPHPFHERKKEMGNEGKKGEGRKSEDK